MFFGLEGERIYVNTSSGGVGVVLVRLDIVEVVTISFRETIMTIELEFGRNRGVSTRIENIDHVATMGSYISGNGVSSFGSNGSGGINTRKITQYVARSRAGKSIAHGVARGTIDVAEVNAVSEVVELFAENLASYVSTRVVVLD